MLMLKNLPYSVKNIHGTNKIYVKNIFASTEYPKRGQRIWKDRFITKTPLNGIYQDVYVHGLSNTTGPSSQSAKEKFTQHAVRYLEDRFSHYKT